MAPELGIPYSVPYHRNDGAFPVHGGNTDLITVWRTTAANETVTIPFQYQGHTSTSIATAIDLDVDWGDGTSESFQATNTNAAYIQHTYADAGDHEVKITGRCSGLFMGSSSGGNDATNRNRLIEVKNWGDTKITGLTYMLAYCTNVVVTAKDGPTRLPLGEDAGAIFYSQARRMFYGCDSIIELDISMWDPSLWDNITYAYEMLASIKYCETLKMPSGISLNANNCAYMMHFLGYNASNGANIEWNYFTNSNTSINYTYMFSGALLRGINRLNNWTIGGISQPTYMMAAGSGETNTDNTKIELKDWSTTGNGFTQMSNFLRGGGVGHLDISGWNANMTENASSWAYFAYSQTNLKQIKGLNNLKLNGCTSLVFFLYNTRKLLFGPPGSDTNFASDAIDNSVGGGVRFDSSFYNTSYNGDNGDHTNAYPPNMVNWNMSRFGAFNSMFQSAQFNSGIDISNWDMSGATSIANMFYNFCSISRPTTVTTQFNNLSSILTTVANCWRGSAVTNAIFNSNCDLSGVTTFSHSMYYPNTWRGNIFSLVFDNNVDFSSVTSWQTNDGANVDGAEYDLIINRNWATNNNTGVPLRMNFANFNGDLIFPSTLTETMTNFNTVNKVIDTNKDFVSLGVQVNDIVYTKSGSSYQFSKVTNVAATELTLADNIVSSGYRYYNVGRSDAIKNKYNLISQRSWTFLDNGPIIS